MAAENVARSPVSSNAYTSLSHAIDPSQYKWHQIIRDKVGYFFFNIASLCTEPACKMHEKVTLLKLSKQASLETQNFLKLNHLAQRVYLVGQIALLFPISVFTGPVGMVFRMLGYFTQYSEFNYFQGLAKEKLFPTDGKASVFFLNACFIGGGYPLTHGGVLPWRSRVAKVAENIKQENADVVCLSEVYDFKAAQILYDKLKDQYSHFYLNIGPHHWAAKSGLFVASKYRIQNPHFIDFHSTLVHNKGSCRRGGFAFEAVDREHQPIARVYSAHLEYSLNDSIPSVEEIKARRQEIDLIVKDIADRTITCPVLITGDLNFTEQEYRATQLAQFFDKTNISNREAFSGTCRRDDAIKRLWGDKEEKAGKEEEEAFDLDHTFILRMSPRGSDDLVPYPVQTRIIPSFDETAPILTALSDHHAMKTDITLSS